ncbi:hypothetical protein [Caballeronia sp. CLC5]|uniref:hypothetical protein n=1 Tax=Caballeronia sp. CLC5 TaxID=2906764 RepID=UPI001F2E0691|nr:hypothetical protein [Caballeronia sp. CLC5]MCE4568822.1 hypothetical protein [Caballeronia sp. CLC5]
MNLQNDSHAPARIDAAVAAANGRVRRQIRLIKLMTAEGCDTQLALRVLKVLRDSRDALAERRDLTLESISLVRRCLKAASN